MLVVAVPLHSMCLTRPPATRFPLASAKLALVLVVEPQLFPPEIQPMLQRNLLHHLPPCLPQRSLLCLLQAKLHIVDVIHATSRYGIRLLQTDLGHIVVAAAFHGCRTTKVSTRARHVYKLHWNSLISAFAIPVCV